LVPYFGVGVYTPNKMGATIHELDRGTLSKILYYVWMLDVPKANSLQTACRLASVSKIFRKTILEVKCLQPLHACIYTRRGSELPHIGSGQLLPGMSCKASTAPFGGAMQDWKAWRELDLHTWEPPYRQTRLLFLGNASGTVPSLLSHFPNLRSLDLSGRSLGRALQPILLALSAHCPHFCDLQLDYCIDTAHLRGVSFHALRATQPLPLRRLTMRSAEFCQREVAGTLLSIDGLAGTLQELDLSWCKGLAVEVGGWVGGWVGGREGAERLSPHLG
jgi:hypothetical protein